MTKAMDKIVEEFEQAVYRDTEEGRLGGWQRFIDGSRRAETVIMFNDSAGVVEMLTCTERGRRYHSKLSKEETKALYEMMVKRFSEVKV